jgi:hypothetical protein
MDPTMMKHLFQYLNRIEKKLDEVLKLEQMSLESKAPFHLMQGLGQPGQSPCSLCGKVPVYRKINIGYDQTHNSPGDTVTLRICACEPRTEEI